MKSDKSRQPIVSFELVQRIHPVNSADCSVQNFRVRFAKIDLTNKTIGENKFDRPEVKKTVKIIRSQIKNLRTSFCRHTLYVARVMQNDNVLNVILLYCHKKFISGERGYCGYIPQKGRNWSSCGRTAFCQQCLSTKGNSKQLYLHPPTES